MAPPFNLSQLFMDAPVGVLLLKGPNHLADFMNTEALRFSPSLAYHGKTYAEVFGPHPELPTTEKILSSAYFGHRTFSTTESSITRDWQGDGRSSSRYFNYVIKPIFDESNKAEAVIVFSTDITEQVLARGALEKQHQWLETFLAVAAHELKTPLTSANLQIQLAKRMSSIPLQAKEIFARFERQLGRLTRLTETLFDFSKIQNGKLSLYKEKVSLRQLIDEVIGQLREALNGAKCQIEVTGDDSITGLWDPGKIEQVFENLMSNALKYAPGTKISVEIKRVDDEVEIAFADTGAGIPLASRAKIFDRFERADRTASLPGMGIGLFVVKELISAHGGTILLDPHFKGARFLVRLPLNSTLE